MQIEPVRERSRRTAGFTLVELTIAVALFTFGMLSLNAMQLHAMRGGSSGRHGTRAAAIAESQMEQLQRLTWAQLVPTAGWTAPVTVSTNVQTGGGTSAEQVYSLDWRITDSVVGWTREIDVRVTWDEPQRSGRNVVFSSIRFNREAS